jgi:hypothetical protein
MDCTSSFIQMDKKSLLVGTMYQRRLICCLMFWFRSHCRFLSHAIAWSFRLFPKVKHVINTFLFVPLHENLPDSVLALILSYSSFCNRLKPPSSTFCRRIKMVVDTMPTPPDLRLIVSQLFPDESEKKTSSCQKWSLWTVEWENDEKQLPNLTTKHHACISIKAAIQEQCGARACLHSSVAFWAPFWRSVEFRGNLSPNGGSKKRVSCCNRTLYHWATNATLPREKSAPDVSRCEFVIERLAWVNVRECETSDDGQTAYNTWPFEAWTELRSITWGALKIYKHCDLMATIASLQSSFFTLVGCDQPQQSTIPE